MSTQSFSAEIEGFLQTTKEKYVNFEITLKTVELGGNSIYVFFVKSSENELKSFWAKINSWIGANFQPLLVSEFQRWNLYIFFMVSEKVENALKHQIENNTLACRKLVIEGENSFEDIVEDHITNASLKIALSAGNKMSLELNKDPDLDTLLSNTSIRRKKNKQNAKAVFDSLYQSLKSK